MKSKLASAPVRWTLGQPLLPEHFEAQENALRDELRVRLGGLGAPRHGVLRLRWDGAQLDGGVVRIQDLTYVTPEGRVIDIPGNAEPVAFDLEGTGHTRVPVYLVHRNEPDDRAEGGDRQEGPVTRAIEAIQLVAAPSAAPEGRLYQLACFEKDMEGIWRLDPSYVPPSPSLAGTPFFRPIVDQLRALLDRFHEQLRRDVRDDYLAGHLVLAAQQAMRSVFHLEGFLADLQVDLDPHPYRLFEALRSLYVDVCIYREIRPTAAVAAYEHEDLAGCFGTLLDGIQALLAPKSEVKRRASYVAFGRQDGLLIAEVRGEVAHSRQLFLLVQLDEASEPPDMGRHKLASPSRLAVVHRRSLRGVPLTQLESAPFHHDFASDVRFFRLELGDEWDHVVSERAVAFFDRAELRGMRMYLYWR